MKRVRRRRGFYLPPNTLYVGRGSRWGNPFRIERRRHNGLPVWSVVRGHGSGATYWGTFDREADARHWAVRFYRAHVAATRPDGWLDPLRDRDLACWCDPADGMECHADVLLELLRLPR